MMFKYLLAFLLSASAAFGQSNPGFVSGQIPTATQWNSYFSAKQDVLGVSGTVITVQQGGTGASSFISGMRPVIANGTNPFTVGNFSGNTTSVATYFGTVALAGCAQWNAQGNLINTGSGCGVGNVSSVSFTGGIVSVANPTTTPALTVAGTSGGLVCFTSGSAWASSTLLGASALIVGGGAGVCPSTIATGANVIMALGNAVGTNGGPVVFNGAGGAPSSLLLTNATGLVLTAGAGVTGVLPVANGGNGTATPVLTAGSGVTITGSWPAYTINATGTGGTVTSVSVVTANGVSGSVATGTTTPAITLTLGAITPSSVNGQTITAGSGTLTLGSVTLNAGAGGTLGTNAFTSTAYIPLAGGSFTGGIGFSVTNTLDIGTSATVLAPRTVYAGTSFVGPVGTFTTSVTIGAGSAITSSGAGGALGTAAFTAASAYEVPLTFSTGLTRTVNTITVNTTQNILALSNLNVNGIVTTGGGTGTLGVATILPIANGGSGTATPAIVAGTGITVSGSWPNQTINSSASGGTVTSVGFTGGLISVATATTTPALTVAGTSGGVVCFTSTSTWASSALITANALTLGGGAGVCPSPMGSLGTTTTVLHGNAAGAPTFGAVSLTADVSGVLPGAGGGTGVANTGFTITLAGNLVTTGAFNTTFAQAATTTVTLPATSSTMARTDAGQTFTGVQTMTSPAITTPAITGISTGSGVATAATASTLTLRDASANTTTNALIPGYATTATAAGTTTLTVTSSQTEYFTGATTQTLVLPVTSTLALGFYYDVVNLSTGAVTVQSSGANAILILAAGTSARFEVILTSGTTAASWNAKYLGDVVATGKKLTVSNTITLAGTDATTMTFPASSATVAGLSIAETFTGTQTFSGTSSTLAASLVNVAEPASISATAATGTINYDLTTQSINYYTSNASANWITNFRASSGTSLNTAMATNQIVTAVFMVTQGGTPFYNNVVQVDGNSITPKWQGGTAPSAGNASGIDVYTYSIIKTGSAAFTILASQTQFK